MATKSERKRQQRDLKKLRDAGLIDKRTNLRKSPSKGLVSKLRQFSDVLSGKAKAVKVDKQTAKKFRRIYRTKGDIVVIPRAKGERVYFDRSERKIKSVKTVKSRGKKRTYRKTIERDISRIKPPKRGRVRLYRLPLFRGKKRKPDYITSDNLADLESLIGRSKKLADSFGDWKNYIEVIDVSAEDYEEGTFIGDEGIEV